MKPQPVRVVRGVLHKRCCRCGVWKPIDEFYRDNRERTKQDHRPECKLCSSEYAFKSRKNPRDFYGYIAISSIQPQLERLIAAVGAAETARRIGVRHAHLWRIQHKQRFITRHLAAAIVREFYKAQDKGEKRTREEILHGTQQRRVHGKAD
jgi:hypothetical protein